ncbi:MAG: hypothetical protein D6679_03500 [Candidatus Hydrogenedentota bacterium]|nr:MAG: hypothetical protein D6679_03500 [Candidatus Hydrogenedentota bacterium]
MRYSTPLLLVALGLSTAYFVTGGIEAFLPQPQIRTASDGRGTIETSAPIRETIPVSGKVFGIASKGKAVVAAPAPAPARIVTTDLRKIALIGLLGTSDSASAAAILRDVKAESVAVVYLGDAVFGSDEYLSAVEPTSVVLATIGGDWSRRIELGEISEPPRVSSPASAGPAAGNAEGGIVVSRAEINASVKNPEEIIGESKIVPEFRGGKMVGFRISEVSRSSIVYKMGIRSGDVIKSVNGQRLDSLERAPQIWKKMKNVSQIRMAIERNGKETTMSYVIRP